MKYNSKFTDKVKTHGVRILVHFACNTLTSVMDPVFSGSRL